MGWEWRCVINRLQQVIAWIKNRWGGGMGVGVGMGGEMRKGRGMEEGMRM